MVFNIFKWWWWCKAFISLSAYRPSNYVWNNFFFPSRIKNLYLLFNKSFLTGPKLPYVTFNRIYQNWHISNKQAGRQAGKRDRVCVCVCCGACYVNDGWGFFFSSHIHLFDIQFGFSFILQLLHIISLLHLIWCRNNFIEFFVHSIGSLSSIPSTYGFFFSLFLCLFHQTISLESF